MQNPVLTLICGLTELISVLKELLPVSLARTDLEERYCDCVIAWQVSFFAPPNFSNITFGIYRNYVTFAPRLFRMPNVVRRKVNRAICKR